MDETRPTPILARQVAALSLGSVVLLWLAQPPFSLWAVAFFALVPWLGLIVSPSPISRRGYTVIWAASTLYWLITLQGLRHAHPAMYVCWIALAGYLAIYHVAFVSVSRRLLARGVPLIVTAPMVWVATECIRNYLLTGISAAMLGHTMADVPLMIQIADLGGSYGIGFVIVCVNVAMQMNVRLYRREVTRKSALVASAFSIIIVLASVAYGTWRMSQPLGEPLATFALLQRDEEVVYELSNERELEIFQNYARQSIDAVQSSDQKIDVVVWPESMFSGGSPWMMISDDAVAPEQFIEAYPESKDDPNFFRRTVEERQKYFLSRAAQITSLMSQPSQADSSPAILAGCGVIEYDQAIGVYSGVVLIESNGRVKSWYGKTHLVMFGEYIPILPWIPGLKSLIPPGMGLRTGPGANCMNVAGIKIAANICIETAVERVTVNQLSSLRSTGQMPDVIATVTNDGWFDDSSVIDHHLRCAQVVAVACRRPLVSAANNGPTAAIDSNGQIVKRLPTGATGTLIVSPKTDERKSLYLTIGAIPAWLCVAVVAIAMLRREANADR